MSINPFTGEFESRRGPKLTISRVITDRGPDVCIHLLSADGTEVAVLSLEHASQFVSPMETRWAISKWLGEMNNTKPSSLPVNPQRDLSGRALSRSPGPFRSGLELLPWALQLLYSRLSYLYLSWMTLVVEF